MKNIKSNMLLLAALAGSLATPAFGQVQLVVTGSTAFRSVDEDRAGFLFDSGATTNSANGGLGGNYVTYSGTCNNLGIFPNNTQVTIYMSFSGSITGMQAVQQGTGVPCNPIGSGSSQTTFTPDLAFADVFPGAARSPDSHLGLCPGGHHGCDSVCLVPQQPWH